MQAIDISKRKKEIKLFEKAAYMAADCTLKNGVLLKGFGLCHGITGNAYCFLSYYRATGDAKWLNRAFMFGSMKR